MGLIRKMMSVSTLGAVDFRSDKERTAAYTREAARQARAQTRIMRQQAKQQAAAAPQGPPAGWYADPYGQAATLRWWDGSRWTEHVQPSG